MRPRPIAALSPSLVALGTLLLAGCGRHNVTTDVPVDVGFAPLEPLSPSATYPPAAGNVLHPQGLGPMVELPPNGNYRSHAVGYINAPLAKVYTAFQDPASGYIRNQNGNPGFDPGRPINYGVENFPISFTVHYKTVTSVGPGTVITYFDVTTRGGVSAGNELAPLEVGRRYDKTWGTPYITVMSGSLVARPVPGDEGVTEVELESWLKAQTQFQADCNSTLVDQFNELVGVVAALPP
jgi:hypothetical protein